MYVTILNIELCNGVELTQSKLTVLVTDQTCSFPLLCAIFIYIVPVRLSGGHSSHALVILPF